MNESDQPGLDHFDFGSYVEKPRWNSYWHQLDEVFALEPDSVLLVGVGDGIVRDVLKARGLKVHVVDVVGELEPDTVSDVRSLPFDSGSFDVALCCQVLEHIPFDTVELALSELNRVARKAVVISVPDHSRSVSLMVDAGPLQIKRSASIPRRDEWEFNGMHYWEVGAKDYRLSRLVSVLEAVFSIEKNYLVPENSYHRFFVLGVKN